MSGSTRHLLYWVGGVLVAAAVTVLGVIFVVDIYLALQEPDPLAVERSSSDGQRQ